MSRAIRSVQVGSAFLAFFIMAISQHSIAGNTDDQFLKEHIFSPVARSRVKVEEVDQNLLIRLVQNFAFEHHFGIEQASYPQFAEGDPARFDRMVVNLNIRISPKSFFHLGNFVNANTYDFIAYSHEDASAWRNSWEELMATLAAKFGRITQD